jgi:hypothetical protein
MEQLVLAIPALYGDHHTTAVRGILAGIGVSDMIVSPAFHQVFVRFDPAKTDRQAIESALAAQGYVAGAPEPTYPVSFADRSSRHTATASGTGGALAFAERTQVVEGRPLWPCPGFDPRTPRPVA